MGPPFPVHTLVSGSHFALDFCVVFAIEGGRARENDEQDYACRPNVAAVVLVALQHLWGCVVRSAGLRGENIIFFLLVFGQAEVDHFDVPGFLVNCHEVFGFEVAVHDVLLVAVVERAHDADEDLAAHVLVELALVHYAFE